MEFNEIVVKESPGLCRCCLSEGCYKDLGSEYTWMNEAEVYADMLLECFDISITQHNEGPNGPSRLICEVCITRLRDACNFKKQVLDSEKKFIDMLGRGEFRPKVLIYQTQMKTENSDEQVQEEVEYLEDDLDFDDDEVLKPSVDEHSSSPLETVTSETISLKRKLKTKKTKISRPKKHVEVDEKPKSSKAVSKDNKRGSKTYTANYFRRKNLQILFNNTTLIPFKWRGSFMCFYCGQDFEKYNDLKSHTIDHGPPLDTDRAIRHVKSAYCEVKIDISNIMCTLCKETFISDTEIISHLIKNHELDYNKDVDLCLSVFKLDDLKCIDCDTSFKLYKHLVEHMNKSHPISCYVCNECGQKFNKKRDLGTHIRIRHKKSYTCSRCSENFQSNSDLQKHRKNAHVSTCNVCLQTFSCDARRLKHMKFEHKIEGAECGFCHRVMRTKQGFLRHAAQCKAAAVKSDTVIVDDEGKKESIIDIRNDIASVFNMSTALPFKYFMNRFRCFYCSQDFQDCDELKQHTIGNHPFCDIKAKSLKLRNRNEGVLIKIDTTSLACKICFEKFEDFDILLDHLIMEHKARFGKSVKNYIETFKLIKEDFSCPFCPEVYRYFGRLLNHISGTHTNNKIICMYCGKSFRTDPNLRAHVNRRHKGDGRFKCLQCDMAFDTSGALQIHSGSVHGNKTIGCPACPEKFTTHYVKQCHLIKVHGIGHKCTYCGKLFTRNSHMVDHVRRYHLNEKNVECSVCGEKFYDSGRLKRHMVKHGGERNFHCDICGKKYLWKKNLRGHMTSHSKNLI